MTKMLGFNHGSPGIRRFLNLNVLRFENVNKRLKKNRLHVFRRNAGRFKIKITLLFRAPVFTFLSFRRRHNVDTSNDVIPSGYFHRGNPNNCRRTYSLFSARSTLAFLFAVPFRFRTYDRGILPRASNGYIHLFINSTGNGPFFYEKHITIYNL